MSSPERIPVAEARLEAIRREAEQKGRVDLPGVRAAGGPLPLASPETGYYGQHLLKEPQWTPLIPAYFFVGGAAGALGVIGALADSFGGEKRMALAARRMALAGALLSGALLVVDLGRPSRFLNMLRVFKLQSPMSIGSWVLSGFSGSVVLASFPDVFGRGILTRLIGFFGRAGTVLFGMPFHNYTGVLIGATVIPVWNHHHRSLPREFGMSGLQSAVSLLELSGYRNRASLNTLGLLSAGTESAEFASALRKKDPEQARISEPLRRGRSGLLVTAGAILSGPVPLALRLTAMLAGKERGGKFRKMAAWSGILGSLCLRYGWVEAGSASARDWKQPLGIS